MGVHRVGLLVLDGVLPLDLGIPAQIFGPRADTPYRLQLCGTSPQVPTATGFSVTVAGTLADLSRADTVIVPGYTPHRRPLPASVLDTLAEMHARDRRMVSICTGAFALAAAGVLDGRRATTHWQHAGELAADYPGITIDEGVLYVDEGRVLTSAGVASGIDLCLHIVRRDLGPHLANTVARAIVAAPHREGGQAQYVHMPLPPEDRTSLAATRAWALERIHEPLTVSTLAGHAHTSERSFTRRFTEETGMSPMRWLLRARLSLARDFLEADNQSIPQIAQRTGFGTADNLRLHFRRHLHTTPTAYRQAFRHIAANCRFSVALTDHADSQKP